MKRVISTQYEEFKPWGKIYHELDEWHERKKKPQSKGVTRRF